jgi:hypothetical protein
MLSLCIEVLPGLRPTGAPGASGPDRHALTAKTTPETRYLSSRQIALAERSKLPCNRWIGGGGHELVRLESISLQYGAHVFLARCNAAIVRCPLAAALADWLSRSPGGGHRNARGRHCRNPMRVARRIAFLEEKVRTRFGGCDRCARRWFAWADGRARCLRWTRRSIAVQMCPSFQ